FVVAGRVGGCDVPGLSGFVACAVEDYARAGGFDARCEGYAGEEFTFRLALYLRARADYVRTPPGLLRPMPHSNALRVRHYEEKRLHRSHAQNMRRLDAVLTECTEREGWQDLLFLAPKPRAR